MTHYTEPELAKMQTVMVGDRVGVAIKDHGDGRIEGTALFNNNGPRGSAVKLLALARDNYGVNYLECYGEHLRMLYESLGFVVKTEDAFNEEYAADDWDYDKHNHPAYYTLALGSGKRKVQKKGAQQDDTDYVALTDDLYKQAVEKAKKIKDPVKREQELASARILLTM